VRVAEHDGHIYLDLADEQWREVEIGPEGWRVNKFPPVRFRRPGGMLPLPVPEHGGSIEDLWPILNLSSRNDFVLVVAWLLAALRPAIFLTLAPIGEQQRRSESELWREFEIARPYILGALLGAAVHGLRALPSARLPSLPRMADFALWATACGTALWPGGTFARAYDTNRKAAVEGIIEPDPVAICIRKLMAQRGSWAGTASDLLCVITDLAGDDVWKRGAGWPKNPGALASRLRRAQTFLRVLGIEIAFSREGRAGTRTIRISSSVENRTRSSAPSARFGFHLNPRGSENGEHIRPRGTNRVCRSMTWQELGVLRMGPESLTLQRSANHLQGIFKQMVSGTRAMPKKTNDFLIPKDIAALFGHRMMKFIGTA